MTKYKVEASKAGCITDELHKKKVFDDVYDASDNVDKIDEKLKKKYREAEKLCLHPNAKEEEYTFSESGEAKGSAITVKPGVFPFIIAGMALCLRFTK